MRTKILDKYDKSERKFLKKKRNLMFNNVEKAFL